MCVLCPFTVCLPLLNFPSQRTVPQSQLGTGQRSGSSINQNSCSACLGWILTPSTVGAYFILNSVPYLSHYFPPHTIVPNARVSQNQAESLDSFYHLHLTSHQQSLHFVLVLKIILVLCVKHDFSTSPILPVGWLQQGLPASWECLSFHSLVQLSVMLLLHNTLSKVHMCHITG